MSFKKFLSEAGYHFGGKIKRPDGSELDLEKFGYDRAYEHAEKGSTYRKKEETNWNHFNPPSKGGHLIWDRERNHIFHHNFETGESRHLHSGEHEEASQMKEAISKWVDKNPSASKESPHFTREYIRNAKILREPSEKIS